jgi:uncharacterized membrane protein YvlD (DUF360 family)
MSVHYQILPLSKHHSPLIHRTSLAHLRASIFIFADLARAPRPIAHFLSIPCSLVLIGVFLMLFPFV